MSDVTGENYIAPFRFLGYHCEYNCFSNIDNFNEYCFGILHFYRTNGIFQRIINIPAENATRNGITVNAINQIEIEKKLNEINYKKYLSQMIKLTKLFGACLVVFNIDDEQYKENDLLNGKKIIDHSKPVEFEKIKDVSFYHIYPINEFEIVFNDEKVFDFDYFIIKNIEDKTKEKKEEDKEKYLIHKTRAFFVSNDDIFDDCRNIYNFATSDFFRCFLPITRLEQVLESCTADAQNSQTGIFKVNLNDDFDYTKNFDEEDRLKRELQLKINAIQLSRKHKNIAVIDKEEEYKNVNASLNGFGSIIENLRKDVASCSVVSMAVLFGEKQSGLSNDGSKDLEVFYNMIQGEQEKFLRSILNYLLKLINYSIINNKVIERKTKIETKKENKSLIAKIKNFLTAPVDDFNIYTLNKYSNKIKEDNITFEFNKLWQLSETEQVEVRAKYVELFDKLVSMKVLSPDDVKKQNELNFAFGFNDFNNRSIGDNNDKKGDKEDKKNKNEVV